MRRAAYLFPPWIATHAHTDAGRLRLAEATLTSEKGRYDVIYPR